LFSGRYKSLLVDGSGNGYLRTVCDYVHLNPVRAGMIGSRDRLGSYRWSSYWNYLQRAARRPVWLRVDRLLGELGIRRDDPAGRRHFAEAMEQRRSQDEPGQWRAVRRGWFVGGAILRERLLERMAGEMGRHHVGDERQESAEQKAQRLVSEEFGRHGLTEKDLEKRRKTDATKVKVATRLRRETVMTLDWIAERLRMGSRHTVANCLKEHR
jgi:hypothetical protein